MTYILFTVISFMILAMIYASERGKRLKNRRPMRIGISSF
jgi:hypothetical protein